MNDNMQRRLEEARAWLLATQEWLRQSRLLRTENSQAETEFRKALDRAWEAQCMAQGSL